MPNERAQWKVLSHPNFENPSVFGRRMRSGATVIGRAYLHNSNMSGTRNGASRNSCNSKSSMIVVSNRLPFILKRNDKTGELERKARYVSIAFVNII